VRHLVGRFQPLYLRLLRTADKNELAKCNWTAQGLLYDKSVDPRVNTLRWRFDEVVNAMPTKPLQYKQLVVDALINIVSPTVRRNGEIPDWISDAVCFQVPLTRVPLKPPTGAVINGVPVQVQDKGLKSFVPIGIKDLNIGKNSDLGMLLREFMRQQTYPFSITPTAEELVTCRYTWLNVDVGNFSRMYKVREFSFDQSYKINLTKKISKIKFLDVLRRNECGSMSSKIH
jgi:hypothetical protein